MFLKVKRLDLKIKNIIAITIGGIIFSFGINYFTIANRLAEGGFTGIALLLNYMTGFPPGVFFLLSNIPLFILGWRVLGAKSMTYTIYGTVIVSIFLELFKGFGEPIKDDLLLAALYAGVLAGVGLGIIFRFGGTTGGVDIIARSVQKYWGISMGKTIFVFDAGVIILSLVYLDRERAMYTLIAVFIGAKVIDFIQEGAYSARAAMIISDHAPAIVAKIMNEMERGATLLKGRGGYTGSDREVLYCVVGKREVTRLKTLVQQVDPHAFIVLSEAHDVLGEGFTLDENKMPLER